MLKDHFNNKHLDYFATRPIIYILLCVFTIGGTYLYKLRTEGIFACQANLYSENRYLAECNAPSYGDYDHGGIWYALEPTVLRIAADADVIFLGSSRMQLAFSTLATSQWFASHKIRYYLLGFSSTENIVFTGPLLGKLDPRARFYVINIDRFFDDRISPPAETILNDKEAFTRYRQKKLWQYVHRSICGNIPVLCGNEFAVYRLRENGKWKLDWQTQKTFTVADGPNSNTERWSQYVAIGNKFISRLPVPRDCVVLTIVPSSATKRAEAEFIANALGFNLISPQLQALMTFDRSHLVQSSAERWSDAFFKAAGPKILHCLDQDKSF